MTAKAETVRSHPPEHSTAVAVDGVGVPEAPADLVDDLGCIVFEADPVSLSLTYVSRGAEQMLRYSLERWWEEPLFWLEHIVHPEDREVVIDTIRDRVRAGRDHEVTYRALDADGNILWLRADIRLKRGSDGEVKCLRGFVIDVTEARQTEEMLRKSDERLHLALDAASMGVWDWDVVSSTIYWSDHVYRLHDVLPEEFDGTFESYMRLVDRVEPEDADYAQETIQRALKTGEDYGIEYRVRRKNGDICWLYALGRIYFDESGNPIRVSGTVHDITARKEAEAALRELTGTLEERVRLRTSELERANRMLKTEIRERRNAEASLERLNTALLHSNRELQDFAYVASHDLQEPLRKIITFAELLVIDHENEVPPSMLDYLERIQEAGQRMRALIKGLLEFSRVKTKAQPFEQIQLQDVVHRVLEDLEILMSEARGRVEFGDLPSIEADPMQMQQLFQNLIGNALKFRRKEELPVVRVQAKRSAADRRAGVCRITVQDNGIGFEERYTDRIFTPFQRLHGREDYEGTGMGLAICRRIVERHQGTITATSTPGVGSRFEIVLPMRQVETQEEDEEEPGREGA